MRNNSEVLFRLCANTDPLSLRYGVASPPRAYPPKPRRRRDSLFTKGLADVLDHATSEIASGSKLGIDATKKMPGEGFKRPWSPLIKMDAAEGEGGKTFQAVAAVSLLYKYIEPDEDKDGTPRPIRILQTMPLNATDPRAVGLDGPAPSGGRRLVGFQARN